MCVHVGVCDSPLVYGKQRSGATHGSSVHPQHLEHVMVCLTNDYWMDRCTVVLEVNNENEKT